MLTGGAHPLAMKALGRTVAMGFSGISPLPHTLRTTLKYSEHIQITGTSGGLGLIVFNATSLYDPNYTDTGHQPRGFDQIMPLYDHYVVLRSRIRAWMVSGTASVPIMAGVALSATVTNQGDWDDYTEGPRCTPGLLDVCLTSGGLKPTQFHNSYDAREFLGIPDPVTAGKLAGTISANPTDGAFYHCFAQDVTETASIAVRLCVEIEYDAVFIEPLNPPQS
jgi:hypothetical protein